MKDKTFDELTTLQQEIAQEVARREQLASEQSWASIRAAFDFPREYSLAEAIAMLAKNGWVVKLVKQ